MSKNDERYLLQALEIEGVLRACLYRYTRNNSDVDELLQEVYARLLVSGASDEPEVRSVRAFALTIARNVAFDWLRHRQVVPIELVADLEALEARGATLAARPRTHRDGARSLYLAGPEGLVVQILHHPGMLDAASA